MATTEQSPSPAGDPNALDKLRRLEVILRDMGSLLVAYSGGVDSTFLLSVAAEVLGDRAVAATACSETYVDEESQQAQSLASSLGVRHIVFETSELALPGFSRNPVDRCYYCKRELFTRLREIADREGLAWVAHAAQADDLGDHRPGHRAAAELGIRAPLLEADLTKDDIRSLSRARGLPTWNMPSMACLASRIPYGQTISAEKLHQVAEAERFLRGWGLLQVRVRHHGDTARIEVSPADLPRLVAEPLRATIVEMLASLGFTYVTLDLQGYRTGSMNEALAPPPAPDHTAAS
jgi:uncharacterized protein